MVGEETEGGRPFGPLVDRPFSTVSTTTTLILDKALDTVSVRQRMEG